jgi:hypothetical protein
MGILGKLLGEGAAKPIEAVGSVLDELFTSDEERLTRTEAREKLAQRPQLATLAILKAEAQHRSVFVAGARPSILWVCALSLGLFFVPQYAAAAVVWIKVIATSGWTEIPPYPVDGAGLVELTLTLLGLGAYRTIEKAKGLTK